MQEVIQSKETEVKGKGKSKVNMVPSWPDNWQISKWTQIWLEGAPWQIGEYHKKQSYDKSRQHIKRQRCHFADKGSYSQSYGFSSSHVQMWVLDHKKKKAECQRTDVFDLCWWRLLRVPWTARRSSQSILKEINPEYSLEGLMLKLKLQHSGHLRRRADSLEKTLMLGKIEGRRRRRWQRMRWLDGTTDAMDMNLSKLKEVEKDREAWHASVHEVALVGHNLGTEQQQEARGTRFPATSTFPLGRLAPHCLWSQELVLVFQLLSFLTASISVFSPEWISRRKLDFLDQCNIPICGLMHPPAPLNRPKHIIVFGPLRNLRKSRAFFLFSCFSLQYLLN